MLIHVSKKQRKIVHTTPGMYKALDIQKNNVKRTYEFIGDHTWRKTNAISNADGTDNMECVKCGIKATRTLSGFSFDKRTSANKIENCKK